MEKLYKCEVPRLQQETKDKLDKWMSGFSGKMNSDEDMYLFDALYDCICWRVDDGDLRDYLLENKHKFTAKTNTDLLITHAIDCYHAMEFLVWAQNGRLLKDNPMFY